MLAALGLVLVALLLLSGPKSAGRRLRRIADSAVAPADPPAAGRPLQRWRFALAAGAAVAGVLGFGGLLGIGLAAVSASGIVVVLGRAPPAPTAPADQTALVMELVAGCLDAGLAMVDAFTAGRRAARDPALRDACDAVIHGFRRGDRPDQVFGEWGSDPVLAPFGRAAARAAQSGAAVADELRRCAIRLRAVRRTAVRRRVQQVSVFVAVPLGLCFLPAFVCVAVVPTVVGLFPALH